MPAPKAQKVTQTNKVELTPEQKKLMGMGMEQVDKTLAGGGPTLPETVGFDPAQTAAQEGVLAKQGQLQGMSNNIADASNFLTKDVMNIDSNPYLRQAMDAALRPITENFQNVVMPAARGDAVSAGALGSPKGNARGQAAINSYQRQVGDTTATMGNTAYGQNLDAMTKALALAPQSQQATLFPEIAMEGVGAQRRGLQQEAGTRDFNQQMLPFTLGQQLISSAAGAPGAGSTSTVQGAQPQQSWTQMLGAGVSAASMLAGFL